MAKTTTLNAAANLYIRTDSPTIDDLTNAGETDAYNRASIGQRLTLWVTRKATDILSADEVRAVYTAAKSLTPGGNAISGTNRVCLLIPAGRYDFVTTPLVLDTAGIDIHVMGSATFTSQVSAAGHGTLEQTEQDVHISAEHKLSVEIDSAYAGAMNSTDAPAAYFPAIFPIVSGDTYHTIANANEITVPERSRNGNLIYAEILDNTGSFTVNFYKAAPVEGAFNAADLIGHTPAFTKSGRQTIYEDNASGILGWFRADNYSAVSWGGGPNWDIHATTGITIKVAGRGSITNVDFFSNDETKAWSMRLVEHSGFYTNCTGGKAAFGGVFGSTSNYATVVGGNATGTFVRCIAGDQSYGGCHLYSATYPPVNKVVTSGQGDATPNYGGFASGTFIECVGGDGCWGGTQANGLFWRCTGRTFCFGICLTGECRVCVGDWYCFGSEHGSCGECYDCVGGQASFSGSNNRNGHFERCTGGDGSFGCSGITEGATYIDCLGGNASFGGYGGTVENPTATNATLIRCALGTRVGNAIVYGVAEWRVDYDGIVGFCGYVSDCYWKVTGTNNTAMLVRDGAKIHNCTIIGNGNGYSIGGGVNETHVTAEIVHCRMNKGLGPYVDNSCATPSNAVIV